MSAHPMDVEMNEPRRLEGVDFAYRHGPPTPESLRGRYEQVDGWWACSHCGPHEASTATWCAAGCGGDYVEMEPIFVRRGETP